MKYPFGKIFIFGWTIKREVLSTSVSLDRVQQILEERKANLSSSSSDEEERPKSTKSIRSRYDKKYRFKGRDSTVESIIGKVRNRKNL